MIERIWNKLDLWQRVEICKACRWNNRSSQAMAKKSYEQLSIAAKNVMNRYYDEGKLIGVIG